MAPCEGEGKPPPREGEAATTKSARAGRASCCSGLVMPRRVRPSWVRVGAARGCGGTKVLKASGGT